MFREPYAEPEHAPAGRRYSDEELREVISHLYKMERQYGIVIAVITKGDVEEAWNNEFFSDDKEPPPFTDEVWSKFQDTYEWRKGFADVMWNGVHETLTDTMVDFVRELSE